jgi:hypothetical protein
MVVASLNIYARIMYYMQLFVKGFSCDFCLLCGQYVHFCLNFGGNTPTEQAFTPRRPAGPL